MPPQRPLCFAVQMEHEEMHRGQLAIAALTIVGCAVAGARESSVATERDYPTQLGTSPQLFKGGGSGTVGGGASRPKARPRRRASNAATSQSIAESANAILLRAPGTPREGGPLGFGKMGALAAQSLADRAEAVTARELSHCLEYSCKFLGCTRRPPMTCQL